MQELAFVERNDADAIHLAHYLYRIEIIIPTILPIISMYIPQGRMTLGQGLPQSLPIRSNHEQTAIPSDHNAIVTAPKDVPRRSIDIHLGGKVVFSQCFCVIR